MKVLYEVPRKQKVVLLRAIDQYGKEQQIDKTIEELSELIKALSKYKQSRVKIKTHGDKVDEIVKNIAKESCDVLLCLHQINIIFKFGVDNNFNAGEYFEERITGLEQELNKNL